MAAGAVGLPEGFVLDQPPASAPAATGLPDGFVLDGPQQGSGIAANIAGGANSRIADVMGIPSRVANAIQAPVYSGVMALDDLLRPLLGGQKLTDEEKAKAYELTRMHGDPKDIESLMGKAGFDPRDVKATTGAEKFAHGAGAGLVDALTVAAPATAVANASRAETMTGALSRALAAQPAAQVASSAVGEGTQDATDNPWLGLAAGLLTGGAMGAGKTVLDNMGERRALVNSAPTTDMLREQANNAYRAADDAGLVVTDKSFGGAVKDITDAAVNAGIDKDIHPKASAVLRRLAEEADTPKTLQDLDILRRVAKGAAGSIEPDERRIGSIMVDKLDDYVAGLKPSDVAAGDVNAAASALTDARQLWSQMRKSDLIDGIIEKAQTQASGVENGLRIGFRQLLNNKKALRGFSDDEIGAMRQVAEGSFTANALRRLGKFSFGTGVQSNMLGATVGAGTAHMLAGGAAGPLAFAVPVAGYAAQRGAQAVTRNAADFARAVAASGGAAPARTGVMSNLLGDQTKGLNASLLAKILLEQSALPNLTPDRSRVPR